MDEYSAKNKNPMLLDEKPKNSNFPNSPLKKKGTL
jgi:hypothetical protein